MVVTTRTRCERRSGYLKCESRRSEQYGRIADSQVLPLFFPVTYRFILPHFSSLGSTQSYQALASGPDSEVPDDVPAASSAPVDKTTYLTTGEKLALMRPLVLRYMLPLCAVYIEEYIINSVSLLDGARLIVLTARVWLRHCCSLYRRMAPGLSCSNLQGITTHSGLLPVCIPA